MAVKKTQLYASLWASCNKLRGGMDSSEYKDYILTLLFMKYVTDKFKNKGAYEDIKVFDKAHDKDPDPEKRTGCSFDDFIALKGKKNIGEGMDKIIARLADENTDLKGVIDIAHFNDEKKLGSGKEMVDKLTDLISIFQRPELDFSRNKAEGDDIIGDAYEYLMRKFATESGKSKGQFYTPAEVSRILANVVGISRCTDTSATVCDPACGSGSLLIRAIDAAPIPIMGYGQEKESSSEWKDTTLGNICDIKDGTHQTPHYVESGIPFYSVETVTNDDFTHVKYISLEEHERLTSSYKIENGDVLMTRIGSIGKGKYVDWNPNASFYVSLALLKFRGNKPLANFIALLTGTEEFQKEAELHSLQFAIPMKINLGQISDIRVRIPAEESEIKAIITMLNDMGSEIKRLEQKLNKYKLLKQGMMEELLTGKVRLM